MNKKANTVFLVVLSGAFIASILVVSSTLPPQLADSPRGEGSTKPLGTTTIDGNQSSGEEWIPPCGHEAKAEGGPDKFGYLYRDSTVPTGPKFTYLDIGNPIFPGRPPTQQGYSLQNAIANITDNYPIVLNLDDNEVSYPVELGFDFHFYGESYKSTHISSNGFITFSDDRDMEGGQPIASGGFAGDHCLPHPAVPNNLIAGFWSGLDPSHDGNILARSLGEPGHRVFVVEYRNVSQWNWKFDEDSRASFQIHLYEVDDSIEIHYLRIDPDYASEDDFGLARTVAIEDAAGEVALRYINYDQKFAPHNHAVRFFRST